MDTSMRNAAAKKAVMLGAGCVGRGFIGQLLYEWGFETTFVDIDEQLVSLINEYREYPITLLSDDLEETYAVRNVHALNIIRTDDVARAVCDADLMAISVGTNALTAVAGTVAKGIKLRCDRQGPPLNILICENLLNAQAYLGKLLLAHLPGRYGAFFAEKIGLVETTIGRMIPVQTPLMKLHHPLSIHAESYCELPADRDAFKGDVPQYPHLRPYSPFVFYVRRKMYIHNMGHTAAAYLGIRKGYTFIWEAILDSTIRETVTLAMLESAQALSKAYGVPFLSLREHVHDLLLRFGNKRLGDTLARVGRDLPRKLGGDERFFGAARFCQEQGVGNENILKCLQAALLAEEAEKALSLEELRKMADIIIQGGTYPNNTSSHEQNGGRV